MANPENPDNQYLITWIILSRELLFGLGTNSSIAQNAVHAIQVIERALHGMFNQGRPVNDERGIHSHLFNNTADTTPERTLERSMNMVAESPKWLSELLKDQCDLSDELWNKTEAAVFSGSFPGPDVLCDNANPEFLLLFLDKCAAK